MHKLNQKFQIQRRPLRATGFTLVETLVVMVILATVMMAASGLASTVVQSAAKNQARVQAIYLTQECTELLRNVRDSSWRQNLSWQCPFSETGRDPQVYDPADLTSPVYAIWPTRLTQNPVPDCRTYLGVKIESRNINNTTLYESPTGLTHEAGGAASGFQRYFTIDAYDPDAESIDLTCHTVWPNGQVQMTQRLTNWRQP